MDQFSPKYCTKVEENRLNTNFDMKTRKRSNFTADWFQNQTNRADRATTRIEKKNLMFWSYHKYTFSRSTWNSCNRFRPIPIKSNREQYETIKISLNWGVNMFRIFRLKLRNDGFCTTLQKKVVQIHKWFHCNIVTESYILNFQSSKTDNRFTNHMKLSLTWQLNQKHDIVFFTIVSWKWRWNICSRCT